MLTLTSNVDVMAYGTETSYLGAELGINWSDSTFW
jgi:hypothetical protein